MHLKKEETMTMVMKCSYGKKTKTKVEDGKQNNLLIPQENMLR